jgi:hypothetical protein
MLLEKVMFCAFFLAAAIIVWAFFSDLAFGATEAGSFVDMLPLWVLALVPLFIAFSYLLRGLSDILFWVAEHFRPSAKPWAVRLCWASTSIAKFLGRFGYGMPKEMIRECTLEKEVYGDKPDDEKKEPA